MPREVPGRRVGDYDDLEKGGDYALKYDEQGVIVAMQFVLPGFGQWQIIPGPASPTKRAKWEISEDADGIVTVSPSILTWWSVGEEEKRFHGFLKGGVWEILDDTAGGDWDD